MVLVRKESHVDVVMKFITFGPEPVTGGYPIV